MTADNINVLHSLVQKLTDFDLKDDVVRESTVMEAAGGYADVFIGSLKRSKVQVAIKRIRTSMQNDPNFANVSYSYAVVFIKLTRPTLVLCERARHLSEVEPCKYCSSTRIHN